MWHSGRVTARAADDGGYRLRCVFRPIDRVLGIRVVRWDGDDGSGIGEDQRSPLSSSKKALSACCPVAGRDMTRSWIGRSRARNGVAPATGWSLRLCHRLGLVDRQFCCLPFDQLVDRFVGRHRRPMSCRGLYNKLEFLEL